MRQIRGLLELGWRVITEAHTALWVLEMIGVPTLLTGLLAWFFEHSPAVIGAFFVIALGVSVLVTLALLGHRREASQVASPPPIDGDAEWTIGELFFHICPDLERDKENPELRKRTARAVLDELSSGTIRMRGRKIDRPAAKRLPLVWIEAAYWPHVLFTYWFLEREESVLDARNEKTGIEYADLRIDRADALRVWPMPIPLHNAAGLAYEGTRGTEISQLAEAHGREPDGILNQYMSSLYMSVPIVAQKLPSKVYEEVPVVDKLVLKIYSKGQWLGYHDSKEPVFLDPRVRIADLNAFIADHKQRPAQVLRF